jgi:hypothetical protein
MALLLGMLALVICLMSLPVMLAARLCGAGNPGFWPALLANFLGGCFSALMDKLFPHAGLLALPVVLAGTSAIYAFVLGTTLLRGFSSASWSRCWPWSRSS